MNINCQGSRIAPNSSRRCRIGSIKRQPTRSRKFDRSSNSSNRTVITSRKLPNIHRNQDQKTLSEANIIAAQSSNLRKTFKLVNISQKMQFSFDYNTNNNSEHTFNWFRPETDGMVPEWQEGSTVTIAKDSLIMYGGKRYNEVYSLNPMTYIWNKINTTNAPYGRSGHTAVFYQGKLIVFGGLTYKRGRSENSNKVYALNLKSNDWQPLTCTGEVPTPRSYHTSALISQYMVVFGGFTNRSSVLGDLFLLDLEEKKWSKVKNSGLNPPERIYASSSVLGKCFYLFGGRDSKGEQLNDLWIFNMQTFEWGQTRQIGTPLPRYLHSSVLFKQFIIVFGGRNDKINLNFSAENMVDLFDLDKSKWKKIKVENESPFIKVSHCSVLMGSQLFVLSGKKCGREIDLHILSLD